MTQGFTQETLRVALLNRAPLRGLIHHSDRGGQYAAHDYCDITAQCANRQKYPTRSGTRQSVLEFIGYYNHDREHSSLGMQMPAEFEQV
jgi:putative transposase